MHLAFSSMNTLNDPHPAELARALEDRGFESLGHWRCGSCLVHDMGDGTGRSETIEPPNLLHVGSDDLFWRARSLLTWLHQSTEQFVLHARVY